MSSATTSFLPRPIVAVLGALLAFLALGVVFALLRAYATPRTETASISSAAASAPPGSAAGAVSPTPSLPKVDPRNLPNFAEVAPGIYRGAAPTVEGWKKLHALGIRTEIDLRIEKKDRTVAATATKQYGIERLHLPMGREAPTQKQVDIFLATLGNSAKRPVFVHCQHGADRTGAMVGIYRETHDGWDFPKTYTEMRHYGFKPFLTELKGAVQKRAPGKH